MIRPNATITSINRITGHDGTGPVFSVVALVRPLPCQIVDLSERRVQTLSASGIEADRSIAVLTGDIGSLGLSDLVDSVLAVSSTVRGRTRSQSLVVVREVTDPDPGTVGQAVVELLCKAAATDPVLEEDA